ncbi:DUF2225 domain-containing protein [Desertibacillus haloalkaliphilus]|uniref:DUF2225 domain-containing protein n=1 Tax=Desertibacillus haloalkaliphilus TaxID=1328930 RepID=UPI001C27C75F|nr:DUF2225 domain-containing protein [Desertibacillus haloalkaliphilus]MBU8908825.1 DUF2225 domain-containing protein [Desertibacillus haloalkaliphilus]
MSEGIEPFYDKEVTCLLCEHKYITKRLRSRFVRVKRIESDFYTEYKDENYIPYFYEISVCPQCGFSCADTFSTTLLPHIEENIVKKLSSQWQPRNYGGLRTVNDAIETHKLALLSGSLKEEKHIVLAGICLRLSWLYRMKKVADQDLRFLRLSLKYYEGAYQDSDFIGTQMTEMKLLYLIGELHRKVGNQSEAVVYFSRVINHKNRSIEKKVVEMAREQWQLMREEKTKV